MSAGHIYFILHETFCLNSSAIWSGNTSFLFCCRENKWLNHRLPSSQGLVTSVVNHVLPSVVDSSIAHSKTGESSIAVQSCNVHHALPCRILPGTQAMFHMQHFVFDSSLFIMLQLPWQLCSLVLWRGTVSVLRTFTTNSGYNHGWTITNLQLMKMGKRHQSPCECINTTTHICFSTFWNNIHITENDYT